MNTELRDLLHKHIQCVLCLTCPQSIDTRLPAIRHEFYRLGLNDIFVPYLNVHSVIEHAELDRRAFANDGAKATNVKSCTLGHYHMAKFALDAGFDSVMLIEDDARFAPDSVLLDHFRELPVGVSSVLSYWYLRRIGDGGSHPESGLSNWDVLQPYSFFDSAMCYILNREGMKYVADYWENAGTAGSPRRVDACDRIWPHISRDLTLYIPKVQLVTPPQNGGSVTQGVQV